MPKVWNKRDPKTPTTAVYVGRPTKWGNPFKIGEHGTREEVLEKYRNWIRFSDLINRTYMAELKGKDLVCWCAPEACHADYLLERANRDPIDD